MTPDPHMDAPYAAGEELPPWLEEVADPTHWDLAFGSYGDGYLEWVNNRFYWDPADERTIADTRSLWTRRDDYDDPLVVEYNYALDTRAVTREASNTPASSSRR